MAAALSSAATRLAQSSLAKPVELRSSSSVNRAFNVKPCVRVTCSAESFTKKFVDAGKAAAISLAASALVASGASANPESLTYGELIQRSYTEIKGTGIANQCPKLGSAEPGLKVKPGKYAVEKLCLEPTSFTVKAPGPLKDSPVAFQKTKLMTRLTYTLDENEGTLDVGSDGSLKFEKAADGIDYAAVTVQIPGGERVPFLFTIKNLVATGSTSEFKGDFLVPSYRGSSFLDPKGRGGSSGYDTAVGLPAGSAGDSEELAKENVKSAAASKGSIKFQVASSNPSTGEVTGVFVSLQPSDTDLGAKKPKDVKIEGVWYAQLK